jgi:hypothetical protein
VIVSPRKSNDPTGAPPPATVVHRKARPDLYTVFLVIALVAVLIGILFLYLEMQFYEFKIKGAPPVVMTSGQGAGTWGTADQSWCATECPRLTLECCANS